MKKTLKISLSVLLVVFLLAVVLFCFQYWRIKTGRILKIGAGDDAVWMTKENFRKEFGGPQGYEVESKNTPEDTYSKFREALLRNDVEGALVYIMPERRDFYKKEFSSQEALERYKTIPVIEDIKKSNGGNYGNFSSYYYLEQGVSYAINFVKNSEGFWEIENI